VRPARLAVTALLTASAVGILRQRHEASLVRRGVLAPVTAATRTAPPPREGALARAVAGWIPQRPRTRAGRVAAAAWSAPLTLVGAAIGLASGRRPERDRDLHCWVFRSARDGASRLFHLVPSTANAVGQVILTRREQPSALLLAHEATHVRQAERLGVLLIPLYAWWWARHGYRDNPLERAARAGAHRSLHDDATGEPGA
jgi:hypothetical protein